MLAADEDLKAWGINPILIGSYGRRVSIRPRIRRRHVLPTRRLPGRSCCLQTFSTVSTTCS
ncbi:hypothetical protein [Nocardioides sp. B-3]|uniref:hypothetical protein n=1 Tax=Nocardioides sp. B-3 TaxID=2895565 RepID=UPI0021534C11|nr:hypothetical protein [Nocardioides sp. B-3]UUZ60564.1 hypothetical protein LP418_06765 [Nocardioides sp. B-3]